MSLFIKKKMINSKIADKAYSGFELGLKHLTYDEGAKHLSKVCLVCDWLLEWKDVALISSSRLEAVSSQFRGETLFFSTINQRVVEKLKSQYTYKGQVNSHGWTPCIFCLVDSTKMTKLVFNAVKSAQ
jgi:hypothetical protein